MSRRQEQRVFRLQWHRQPVISQASWVYKLDVNICSYAFKISIVPFLPRMLGSLRTLLGWPSRRLLDLVWWSENDINPPPVGLPAWNLRPEFLVGKYDSPVMFFFEVVIQKVRIAAAAKPKLLDKLFAFIVEFQLQKRAALLGRNYVGNIFRQPSSVALGKARKRLLFDLLAAPALTGQ